MATDSVWNAGDLRRLSWDLVDKVERKINEFDELGLTYNQVQYIEDAVEEMAEAVWDYCQTEKDEAVSAARADGYARGHEDGFHDGLDATKGG